jgi:hypothetical protein
MKTQVTLVMVALVDVDLLPLADFSEGEKGEEKRAHYLHTINLPYFLISRRMTK